MLENRSRTSSSSKDEYCEAVTASRRTRQGTRSSGLEWRTVNSEPQRGRDTTSVLNVLISQPSCSFSLRWSGWSNTTPVRHSLLRGWEVLLLASASAAPGRSNISRRRHDDLCRNKKSPSLEEGFCLDKLFLSSQKNDEVNGTCRSNQLTVLSGQCLLRLTGTVEDARNVPLVRATDQGSAATSFTLHVAFAKDSS